MRPPDTNVINLRPEAPKVEPDRPCWGVYEHWVTNEKGRRLKPGVYWHGFKRSAGDDDSDDDKADRPITDEWIATPVTVITTQRQCPNPQEPKNVGNRGNGGTASKYALCSRSPLLKCWGTGGTQTCF